MRKNLQKLAQEISQSLVVEVGADGGDDVRTGVSIAGLLLHQLEQEVCRQVERAIATQGQISELLEVRLQALERKLETLLPVAQEIPDGDQDQSPGLLEADEDDDEVPGEGSRFPNLKYANAKYKNVESILKYVERDEDKGGVKLVIMNFND
ncbi:MAG: hypothetical protein V3U79_01330 [Dehalococcoidia bacterium]